MRLRVFFSFQVRLHRSKRAPVRRSAPSVPGRAVAGLVFAPSSAWSEQACAGAQKRTFRAREGGCGDFFRSKFGFIGASVRRRAEAHLPCPGGRLRGFFSFQVRLHRSKRAPVRRSAPSVPGRAVAGIFFAPSSAWSEKAGAGAQKRDFRAWEGGCGAVFRYTACTEGFVIPNLIRNLCLRMYG